MSVSIYFDANRSKPFSIDEMKTADAIFQKYEAPVIEELDKGETDELWESPFIWDWYSDEPDKSNEYDFKGSVSVASEKQVEYWLKMLSEVRNVMDGAEFEVDLEGRPILWNAEKEKYEL